MTRAFFIGLFGTLLLLLGGLIAVNLWYGDELPSLAMVKDVRPMIRTEVYDRKGRLVATLSREDRTYVRLNAVSPHLLNAILSTEDRQFYRHWGVNPLSLMRASLANLRRGNGPLQGGSTITQQLARNLFLTHEQTLPRKLKEVILALRLERSFSKDEIQELYINQIYFGDGVYGVETASRKFFGKDAQALSIPEAAVLAGIPKNPARYSPHAHPENALARRNVVLRSMRATGAITEDELQAALSESLRVVTDGDSEGAGWHAPYFVEAVRLMLTEKFGSRAIYEDGLTVHTTMDLELQEKAEQAVESHLRTLESRNRYDYLSEPADSSAGGASSQGTDANATRELQAAVVSLVPRTGAIQVMVGGRDFSRSKWNRATQARRQPGSAFKPFTFATAFERGKRTTDVLLDAPIVRFLPNGDRYEPTNFTRTYHGIVGMREILANSINIPSVLLLEEIGVDKVISTAHRLGIESRLPRVLSLALGSGEVTLLEMASAYGSFASGGIHAEPYMVERVEDRSGKVIYEHRGVTEEVLDQQIAFLVTDLMRSAIEWGTGKYARGWGLRGDAAGKTGTTDDYTDAWFIGFNSNLLTGVWVGFDLKETIGRRMTGAVCALPIWTQIMISAADQEEPEPLRAPVGVVHARVCRESGQLAVAGCPDAVEEIFIRGTEPTESCLLHE